MEYELVYDQDIAVFNKKVNDKLSDGWKLYKASYFIRAKYIHCQVLVKKDNTFHTSPK